MGLHGYGLQNSRKNGTTLRKRGSKIDDEGKQYQVRGKDCWRSKAKDYDGMGLGPIKRMRPVRS